tara:strand:- start:305 stop:571 length:267 start_codon:yes stop_codon:yes gene_type:complete
MPEDHEARQIAAMALTRIESHEDHCAERWSEARDELRELHRRWWWLLTSTILAGAGVLLGLFRVWAELQQTLATIQIALHGLKQLSGG